METSLVFFWIFFVIATAVTAANALGKFPQLWVAAACILGCLLCLVGVPAK